MPPYKRKPENIIEWIADGNPAPDAGHIQAALEAKGITFGADGVSVAADGTITIGDTDATVQKLRPALDAIDPATLDPTTYSRETMLAALTSVLAEIRAKPEQAVTPAEKGLIALAGLSGFDSGITAPVVTPLTVNGKP